MQRNHNNEFPAGEMKPATLNVKRGGIPKRCHLGWAIPSTNLEESPRLGAVLSREFPHDLPMSRVWWMLLALLEWSVCSCVFWFVVIATCFTVYPVRGHMEYCCGAYAFVAFGVGWLFLPALLLTGWKRSFAAARWLLLGMGGLSVASALVNLVVGGLSSAPICRPAHFGCPAMELPLWMAVFPLLLLGTGCLLRARCGRRYGHCFYVAALIRSRQMGRRAFALLVGLLALYAGGYLVHCFFPWEL